MIEYDLARKELDQSNAYRHLDSQGSQWVIEKHDEKKLVRRIDRRILPLLCLIYFVQFMDKVILNACITLFLCHELS
jgi:hypothetical protein